MNIKRLINFRKKSIISVVGAGGKTSFINYFVKEYRNTHNILSTTTTKIYLPNLELYDRLILINEEEYNNQILGGVTVCGKYINLEEKIIGLDFNNIDKIVNDFDLVFIESDGSKRKKLKGWNDTEPVIYPKSNYTVGILDISSYDMEINNSTIHRLDKFVEITNHSHGYINLIDLKKIVLSEKGIFKNAIGKKILFINKVESRSNEIIAIELIKTIIEEYRNIEIYYGSIKKEYCIRYNKHKYREV